MDKLTLTTLAAERTESQAELKAYIIDALKIAAERTGNNNNFVVLAAVVEKKLKEQSPSPGPDTQRMISYWLRGIIKGYGVRLDETHNFDNWEQQKTIVRELHSLSEGSVDLDLLLTRL